MPFVRDPEHWLLRFSPLEWVRAGLAELAHAEEALAASDARRAVPGCKRAAGMALNGALICEPNDTWGRSYVEHLAALARDEGAPDPVRVAARAVLEAKPPGSAFILLRSRSSDERLLEATRDVIAHAYAVVQRHEGAT